MLFERASQRVWWVALAVASVAIGCGGDDTSDPVGDGSGRCLLLLHGKGGSGAATRADEGVLVVRPEGNAAGWGGRQWHYETPADFDAARAAVAAAADADGCRRLIVGGFSNGASFAARLYCAGETFGGRVERYVVDDPVPDASVRPCAPSLEPEVVLLWTSALAPMSGPGADCAELDWTCQGGRTIGIDAYADALGTPIEPSRRAEHEWSLDSPALLQWP